MEVVMELVIPVDKLSFIILKAREYDAKVAPSGMNGNAEGDYSAAAGLLEHHGDDSTRDEIHHLIDDLNDEEAIELVALSWVGRGTFAAEDWDEARTIAADEKGSHSTAEYLLGTPLIADYLEEGLAAFNKHVDAL
ncbi:MAG: DUF3775 domain-containing protein [Pseudomonadota bacterium]